MSDDVTKTETGAERSNIVEFYTNKSALITGGSGFLGKVLIEKLLRSCSGLKQIFVLMRQKRNKQPEERFQELFSEPLFDLVRDKGHLLQKVVMVEGDIARENLGMNGRDLSRITREVSVIFHVAATVRFDEPLKVAVDINLVGTKHVIELSRKLARLAALVYVSTAYANCDRSEVDEHVYPVNVDPENLIQIAEWLDQDTLEELKLKLVANRPNTYTYTKALAESLLVKTARDLPVVICRPSIIMSCLKEPLRGWIGKHSGPTGVYLVACKGIIRSVHVEPSIVTDLIPADVVTNLMITSAWFVELYQVNKLLSQSRFVEEEPGNIERDGGKRLMRAQEIHDENINNDVYAEYKKYHDKLNKFRNQNKLRLAAKKFPEEIADVPVFHCTSGDENPVILDKFTSLFIAAFVMFPCMAVYRYPCKFITRSRRLHSFYNITLHYLPAYILDFIIKLRGGEGKFVKLCKKVDSTVGLLKMFSFNEWKFSSENIRMLKNEIVSSGDKGVFNCDIRALYWPDYIVDCVRGLREYILKESPDNLTMARRNVNFVYYRNLCLKVSFVLLLLGLTQYIRTKILI